MLSGPDGTIHKLKNGLLAHPSRLLILAACLHLATTSLIFTIGRLSLMPSQFDREGIGTFAADGHIHLSDSVQLTHTFETEGIAAGTTAAAPLHVRAYSLSLMALHRLIGFNILSIEPINLLLYLAILVLVFKLAEAIFDRSSALLAATIVALWPTLLIHTTQPLRDPLLIASVLALVLIVERWLRKKFSWREAAITGGTGVLVLLVIWIVRLAMWDLARVIIAFGFVLVILRQVRERRLMITNVAVGVMMVAALFVIPHFNRQLQFLEKREADNDRMLTAESAADLPIWERIIARRDGFINRLYDEDYRAGSDVDTEVRFHSRREVILYLPRAAAIGLFAPFPNSWFAAGLLVGRTGRLISGIETLLTYGLEILALLGIWRARKKAFVWLVAATALLGLTALGLIVINVGSLYRLRYPYWILIVIVGAGGAINLFPRTPKREKQIGELEIADQAVTS